MTAPRRSKPKPKKPRPVDPWMACLDRPDGAVALAALIEQHVDRRADRATTERAFVIGGHALMRFEGSRGRTPAEKLIEVVLDRWSRWADRPVERDVFLQGALAVVSARGELARRLVAVIPEGASPLVRIGLACLHAAAGDDAAIARAIEQALAAGATPAQLRAQRELVDAVRVPRIAKLLEV